MITARSFASRNRYEIDVNREFVALGAGNIAAGLSQGFAVTGADSRTAISDAMGGKTQVTGLVAAAAMALILLFLTGPLRYLPISALGAVLVSAAVFPSRRAAVAACEIVVAAAAARSISSSRTDRDS